MITFCLVPLLFYLQESNIKSTEIQITVYMCVHIHWPKNDGFFPFLYFFFPHLPTRFAYRTWIWILVSYKKHELLPVTLHELLGYPGFCESVLLILLALCVVFIVLIVFANVLCCTRIALQFSLTCIPRITPLSLNQIKKNPSRWLFARRGIYHDISSSMLFQELHSLSLNIFF